MKALPLDRLEELAEALLDFTTVEEPSRSPYRKDVEFIS
ncbi:MAG: DUF4351 domain-containing protein [Pseudanabaenaceae cyanobacterium]